MKSTHRKSATENSERRLARMKTWIELAKNPCIQGEEYTHVRFIFYWVAYEAAFGVYQNDGNYNNESQRRDFHHKLARYSPNLITELKNNIYEITKLMELRQSDDRFWYKRRQKRSSKEEWNNEFNERTREFLRCLYDGIEISRILDKLFSKLNVVRNQIVHGASSGSESFGRNQVAWGEDLLKTLVPVFRNTIASHREDNWGEPPFPRVGDEADEECKPPWLEA